MRTGLIEHHNAPVACPPSDISLVQELHANRGAVSLERRRAGDGRPVFSSISPIGAPRPKRVRSSLTLSSIVRSLWLLDENSTGGLLAFKAAPRRVLVLKQYVWRSAQTICRIAAKTEHRGRRTRLAICAARERCSGRSLSLPILAAFLVGLVAYVIAASFDVGAFDEPYRFGIDGLATDLRQQSYLAIGHRFFHARASRVPIAIVIAFVIAWLLTRVRIPGRAHDRDSPVVWLRSAVGTDGPRLDSAARSALRGAEPGGAAPAFRHADRSFRSTHPRHPLGPSVADDCTYHGHPSRAGISADRCGARGCRRHFWAGASSSRCARSSFLCSYRRSSPHSSRD